MDVRRLVRWTLLDPESLLTYGGSVPFDPVTLARPDAQLTGLFRPGQDHLAHVTAPELLADTIAPRVA